MNSMTPEERMRWVLGVGIRSERRDYRGVSAAIAAASAFRPVFSAV